MWKQASGQDYSSTKAPKIPIGIEKYWIFMQAMETQKLPIKDFAKKIICDGHLFYTTKEGRRFYLMQPAMLVDKEFIKKHAPLNTIFDFEPVVKKEIKDQFSRMFKELRYLQFEKDLRNKSLEISNYFHQIFSSGEHFLNFAMVCFDEFSLVPEKDLQQMHSVDVNLFRKSFYSAAFSVITALMNDYYNFPILRDFYNLTFTLDYGLCDTNYSYYVAGACNQENRSPGSGLQWMSNEKATENEMQVFLNHPSKSYDYIKEAAFLSFPELAEIALYQHELASGKGFPRGVSKGQVSSWEAIVIFADSLVDIQEKFEFEIDVIHHLLNFQNTKLADLPVGRIHFKVCKVLDHIENLKGTGS